jgi:hypothetical protein
MLPRTFRELTSKCHSNQPARARTAFLFFRIAYDESCPLSVYVNERLKATAESWQVAFQQ